MKLAIANVRKFLHLTLLVLFFSQSNTGNAQVARSGIGPIDSAQIETMIKLSRSVHRAEDNIFENLQCLDEAREAINAALALGHEELLAKSLDNLGLLYRYHQNYEEAKNLHIRAYELGERLNIEPSQLVIYANNAGVASRYNTNFDEAVKYYLIALNLAESGDNARSVEIACNGLGISMMNIPGMEKEGLDYLKRALKIATETGNKLGQAMQLLSISNYYNKMRNFPMAHTTLNQLMALNKELGDQHGMAMTFQQIGMTYENDGLLQAAIDSHYQALALFRLLNDETQQANSTFQLAGLYFKLGRHDESERYIRQSTAFAETLKQKSLLMNNAFLMAEISEARNQPGKALEYFKIGSEYKDSLSMDQQVMRMASLKRQYDFEAKERELALLSVNHEIQKAELRIKDITVIFMGILIVLMILFAVLGIRSRKSKIAATQMLQQEEKAKLQAIYERNLMEAEMLVSKMQVNPHFMFNSLNAVKYLIQSNKNENALEYLLVFSKFIRGVLETSKTPTHTIEEELKLISFYLKLEQNRFSENFHFHIRNDLDRWQDLKVIPSLLLQPIVENAIWHGLLPSEKEIKRLDIRIRTEDERLLIEIEDNGVGRRATPRKSHHHSMGHEIIGKRIDLFNQSGKHQISWQIHDKVSDTGNPQGTLVAIAIKIYDVPQVTSEDIMDTNLETLSL